MNSTHVVLGDFLASNTHHYVIHTYVSENASYVCDRAAPEMTDAMHRWRSETGDPSPASLTFDPGVPFPPFRPRRPLLSCLPASGCAASTRFIMGASPEFMIAMETLAYAMFYPDEQKIKLAAKQPRVSDVFSIKSSNSHLKSPETTVKIGGYEITGSVDYIFKEPSKENYEAVTFAGKFNSGEPPPNIEINWVNKTDRIHDMIPKTRKTEETEEEWFRNLKAEYAGKTEEWSEGKFNIVEKLWDLDNNSRLSSEEGLNDLKRYFRSQEQGRDKTAELFAKYTGGCKTQTRRNSTHLKEVKMTPWGGGWQKSRII
eukprot:GHVU01067074.1.p1 GENE.GHVU01067074.1~~GHVU01067074.1.p1  ORF type:complete len:315 (-),score=22.13 GHVU01067074.1:67-1011(-)